MQQPIVVAHGVGRDSTAMLIRMWKLGQRPDAILFANVGSEKRQTYEFIPVFREWLKSVDFPPLTIVQYAPKLAPYFSLEGNMVLNATLPGATFNRGSCTLKFKVEPQNKWTRHWVPAQRAWEAGLKVRKLIGFDCDEEYRQSRAADKAHKGAGSKDAERYEYDHPLIEWGMGLEDCKEEIASVGLPVPCKSACYFCPNQKEHEVDELDPEDRSRIILIELVAEPYNQKVHGLWRRPRKRDNRPGSITQYILERELPFVPLHEICSKVVLNEHCKKVKVDGEYTFDPPHQPDTLRKLLEYHGHRPPEVVLPGSNGVDVPGIYLEDARKAPQDDEDELHEYFEGAL